MSHKSLTTAVLSVLGEEEENYNSLIIQEIEIIWLADVGNESLHSDIVFLVSNSQKGEL